MQLSESVWQHLPPLFLRLPITGWGMYLSDKPPHWSIGRETMHSTADLYLFLLVLGSVLIHRWQNTRLPHRTPAIFLSAFTCTLNQPLLRFINFPPFTTSPPSPRWTFFFLSLDFQHNLAVIDGGFRLTTCLWMRGMASTLKRIFFWEGVN